MELVHDGGVVPGGWFQRLQGGVYWEKHKPEWSSSTTATGKDRRRPAAMTFARKATAAVRAAGWSGRQSLTASCGGQSVPSSPTPDMPVSGGLCRSGRSSEGQMRREGAEREH